MATTTRQIISANDLLDGHVVYLTANGGWTGEPGNAVIAENAEDASILLATAEAQQALIVGPYLVDIEPGLGTPEPVLFREKLRVTGPSMRSDTSLQ